MTNLVTVTRAAEIMGVHPNTIRNWIRSGKLNAMRVGPKLIRIHREELVGVAL
jgi:excisionase family DNA binding protein